jgi:hypothetical protein
MSAVDIAAGKGLENRKVAIRIPAGTRFSLPTSPKPVLESMHSLIKCVQISPPGVQHPERKAVHSTPTRTRVNRMSDYTSTPHGLEYNYIITGNLYILLLLCTYVYLYCAVSVIGLVAVDSAQTNKQTNKLRGP